MVPSRRRVVAPPDEAVDAARVLEFVNTLSARPTSEPRERLVSYAALVAWARGAKVMAGPSAGRLAAVARRRPHAAAQALGRARALREQVHAVLSAAGAGRAPAPATLDALSETVAEAYARGRLVAHEGGLQWATGAGDDLDRITWEVARAAARLLTSPRLARVRACEADDCAWWFLDDTRNHSRRWCDMTICGNREKLRRYRKRSEK